MKKMKKSFTWLTGGWKEMDPDNVLDVLDVWLSSDEEDEEAANRRKWGRGKKEEWSWLSEDMIAFLWSYASDIMNTFMFPVVLFFLYFVYEE